MRPRAADGTARTAAPAGVRCGRAPPEGCDQPARRGLGCAGGDIATGRGVAMAAQAQLHVEIVPWGPSPQAVRSAASAALARPAVRAELGDAESRLLSVVPVAPRDDPAAEPDHVRATVYDYVNERALGADAPPADPAQVSIRSTVKQPLPSGEEFDAAVAALRVDDELGAAIAAGRL